MSQGSFIFPDENGDKIVINGLYTSFEEDSESETKTNLVCSIRQEDTDLIAYGLDGVYDEEGNVITPPTVDVFYIVGNIYSIVGNEKYNILMKDCLLVPAKNIYAINVPSTEENNSEVVDFVSGENIKVVATNYYWGTYDIDEDGITDVLAVKTENLHPTSSFDKIVENDIINNLTLDLKSTYLIGYGEKQSSFSINYPQVIDNVNVYSLSSFDGSNILLSDIIITGKDRTVIDYANKKDKIEKAIPSSANNNFYFDDKTLIYSISKDYVGPLKIKMANGIETSSIDTDVLLFKDYGLTSYGDINSELYAKAEYPFKYYYPTGLKIMTPDYAEERPFNERTFYDYETYNKTGIFEENKTELYLKHDLVILEDTKKILNYTIISDENEILQTGTGTTENGENISIIKLKSGDSLIITGILKENDTDWFIVKINDFVGYIPISVDKDITSKDCNIKLMGTNYTFTDMFSEK